MNTTMDFKWEPHRLNAVDFVKVFYVEKILKWLLTYLERKKERRV